MKHLALYTRTCRTYLSYNTCIIMCAYYILLGMQRIIIAGCGGSRLASELLLLLLLFLL